ncbi:MAG: DsbA family protein, partial [Pseudomonadota bacterium]
MKSTLIYVHDPMCSWCWGFEKTREKLFAAVSDQLNIKRLLGGLAPDSDVPMPEPTKQMVQSAWYRVAEVTGAEFNHDFWVKCAPRRSTYPANRAVIAAREQGLQFEQLMTARVQQAYYLEAKNPSDNQTLIDLAEEIGLKSKRFSEDLVSDATH